MLHRFPLPSFVWLLASLILVLPICVGCGGGSSMPSWPKGTVTGKVTYMDAPITAGSSVMFQHVDTGWAATGTVESDGSFTLRMQGNTKILAGSYKVAVTPPTTASPDETDLEEYAKVMESGGAISTAPKLPEKFNDPDSSGIVIEVEEGENYFEIDLTD